MTSIVVTVQTQSQALPAGAAFGGINVDVVDNSGQNLPGKMLDGTETPPWSHTFTGASGAAAVQVTAQAFDAGGNTLTQPVVATQTTAGGGFVPVAPPVNPPPVTPPTTFPAPVGVSIAVSG